MKLELVIDNREQEIKKYFSDIQNDKISFSNLDIGDILYKVNDNIVLIIERKTIQDLSKSICDGRYREQKLRLLGSGIDRHRIIYLIEGELSEYTTIKGGTDTLLSSLVNMMFRDGLRIHKTSSLKETINFIQKIFDKIEHNYDELWKFDYSKDELYTEEKKYSSVIKTKKKNNITPEIWFHSQLCLIPGISEKIADTITSKYGTLNIFLKEVNGEYSKLNDLQYLIANGKTRKIGPKIVEKIKLYFS